MADTILKYYPYDPNKRRSQGVGFLTSGEQWGKEEFAFCRLWTGALYLSQLRSRSGTAGNAGIARLV